MITKIFIDMDDTICDYQTRYKEWKDFYFNEQYPQSLPGFFEGMSPIKDAIISVNYLIARHNVYFLTAPTFHNPLSYTEKRLWIENHFDLAMCEKLIFCRDKGLIVGWSDGIQNILIDDKIEGHGQENFNGVKIQFGSEEYPDWKTIMTKFYR